MNPKPRGDNFKNYRNDFYSKKEETKEILCLNWAKATNIAGEDCIDFAGSALYLKTKEIDKRDDRINANHSKGLYFTNWKNKKVSSYFLNSDEFLFNYRSTKVFQDTGTPEQQKRTGPEMLETYIWDGDKWIDGKIPNDGFTDLLNETDLAGTVLSNLSHLDRERLIALSSGEAQTKDWYKPEYLKFLIIDDRENLNKITFTQDECEKESRVRYLSYFSALINNIILNKENFPTCIKDLVNACYVEYSAPDFNHNLYSNNGSPAATVAYIGAMPEGWAKKIYDQMFSLLDEDSRRRLVVWFDKVRTLSLISSPPPMNDEDISEDLRSITKGD